MKELLVVTHDGAFHPDEVVGVALVRKGLEVTLVRTRDVNTVKSANIAIDVGGVHNPEMGQYDHHQFATDDANYGKSAAGLLYATMGLSTPYLDAFIKHVDSRDTRSKHSIGMVWNETLQAEVEMFENDYNPGNQHDVFCEAIKQLNNIDIMDNDAQFDKAVNYAIEYIDKIVHHGREYPECSLLCVAADSMRRLKEETYADNKANTVTDGLVTYGKWYPTWAKDIKDGLFLTNGDRAGEYKCMVNTDHLKIRGASESLFTHAGGFISIIKPTFLSECEVTVDTVDGDDTYDICFDIRLLQEMTVPKTRTITLELTEAEIEDLGRCMFAGRQEDVVEDGGLIFDKVREALK